jgi:hypothetical protein
VLASSSIIIRIELLLSTISITKKATLGLGYGQELNTIILFSAITNTLFVIKYTHQKPVMMIIRIFACTYSLSPR